MPEDLKEYVNQHGFEEFCLKHTFDKMLFDNFYNAIIRSDAEVENWANSPILPIMLKTSC